MSRYGLRQRLRVPFLFVGCVAMRAAGGESDSEVWAEDSHADFADGI